MSIIIVEVDSPPSWSLDAIETGESTKCPWVEATGLIACARCTLPSLAGIKIPRWRPIKVNDQDPQSQRKIGDCDQSTKISLTIII